MYTSVDELQQTVTRVFRLDGNTLRVTDEQAIRESIIDPLVFTAVFAADPTVKTHARSVIRQLAAALLIRPASLRPYYLAIGAGAVPATSTVPAINLRTLTYDMACVLFKLKREQHIGPLILELARSEMAFTDQRYDEFAVAVLAAAMKEGYRGKPRERSPLVERLVILEAKIALPRNSKLFWRAMEKLLSVFTGRNTKCRSP